MSQVGEALTDESLEPPLKALVCWNSNPAAIAPDQQQVLAGLRREDLFTVVLEQFMTDTAAHADVVLPATTQLEHRDIVFSWGHHYLTWNEPAIEPLGEAKPNTEIFRLIAERLGFDDPCFRETDDELIDQLLAGFEEGGPARARLDEDRPGPGPDAARRGRLRDRVRQGRCCSADYVAPAEVADDGLAERFPLALVTPKTHLFLNSTFANQRRQHSAQPQPEVVVSPADAGARRIDDGAAVRVWNDRGAFTCAARVSDDARPGVLVAPMGWWNRDYERGRSAQATTSQRLTEMGTRPPSTTTASRSSRSADQAVVALDGEDAADRPVEPRARDAAGAHGLQDGHVGRLLIARRPRDDQHVGARPDRLDGGVGTV